MHEQFEQSLQTRNVLTALIVEPVPALARLLTTMLERSGFRVIAATGADEALTHVELRNNHIDVVISELSMPDMSGFKLALFIGQRASSIPIILLCDQSAPDHLPVAANTAFLEKPFRPEQLIWTLSLLGIRQHPTFPCAAISSSIAEMTNSGRSN